MLDGIRVVDLSTEIAGPYCTKLLADAGADVVKVEPADGDPLRWGPGWRPRGALFEFLNTSKRSVVGTIRRRRRRRPAASRRRRRHSATAGHLPGRAAPRAQPEPRDRRRSRRSARTARGPTGPATEFTLQAWCGSIGSRGIPEAAARSRPADASASGWRARTPASRRSRPSAACERTGRGEHVDLAMLDSMSLTMNTYTSVFAEFLGWPPLAAPDPHDRGPVDRADRRRLRRASRRTARSSSPTSWCSSAAPTCSTTTRARDRTPAGSKRRVEVVRDDPRVHEAAHDRRAARAGGAAAHPERARRQRRDRHRLRPLRERRARSSRTRPAASCSPASPTGSRD